MARHARCRPSRIRRCSMCCATISPSTAPSSAAGSRNAAPARCWSTASRCAPASPRSARSADAEITTLEGLGTHREAASAAEGLHRRAGRAVRLLHQRHDHDGQGAARPQSAADRGRGARRRSPAISAAAAPTIASFAPCCAPPKQMREDLTMNAPALTRRGFTAGPRRHRARLLARSGRIAGAGAAAGAAARQPRQTTACSTPGSASTPTAPPPSSPARSSSGRAS